MTQIAQIDEALWRGWMETHRIIGRIGKPGRDRVIEGWALLFWSAYFRLLQANASRITHHASRITHHASRITHHASRITTALSKYVHSALRTRFSLALKLVFWSNLAVFRTKCPSRYGANIKTELRTVLWEREQLGQGVALYVSEPDKDAFHHVQVFG